MNREALQHILEREPDGGMTDAAMREVLSATSTDADIDLYLDDVESAEGGFPPGFRSVARETLVVFRDGHLKRI